MTTFQEVYQAALRADDAYRAALVAVVGAKKAGDYRYTELLDDPTVRAAREAKYAADEALRVFLTAPLEVAGSAATVTTLADGTLAVLS
jgi:hypothetical protein